MASLPPSLTTELQAVNVLLSVIGEAPVNSLSGAVTSDVSTARNVLAEVLSEVQTKGWHFNTEDDYPLASDQDGNVTLPANTARVSVDPVSYPGCDFTQRGLRLYDKKNHTFTISQTINAKLVLILPFEEVPEAFRRYITIRSARIFQDRTVGSDSIHGFNSKDERDASVAAIDADSEMDNASIFDHPSMQRMVRRY